MAAVLSHNGAVSIKSTCEALANASPAWVIVALISMFGFILFEGLSLICILRSIGYRCNFLQGLLFSASDQYFSAITPSATGGQPASALFMARAKVPGAVITAALLINLVMYTTATLTIGVVCLAVHPDIFMEFDTLSKVFIVFSMIALLALSLIFLGLLKKGDVLFKAGKVIVGFLKRIHIVRDSDKWVSKLESMTKDYATCVRLIAGNTRLLVAVYALNLLQRLSQISVALFMLYALGGGLAGQGADLWFIQAYAQIGSNCIPIPGGMGAADYLMLDGYQMLFDADFAYELQIVSRSISFYICTIASGLITLFGSIATRRTKAVSNAS